jgi:DNA-binding MarR family transcriptional regulator
MVRPPAPQPRARPRAMKSPEPKSNLVPEPDPGALCRRRLPPLLRRAWFSLNQAFRQRSRRAGITPDQFTALRLLHESGPAGFTQRELAERMTSDANTIASMLNRLEQQGFIRRRVDPTDHRAHQLHLQAAGSRKFAQVRRAALALQQRVLRSLPASRREKFLEELEIIAEACHAEVAPRGASRVRAVAGQNSGTDCREAAPRDNQNCLERLGPPS